MQPAGRSGAHRLLPPGVVRSTSAAAPPCDDDLRLAALRLAGDVAPAPAGRVGAVGIITCDRRGALVRNLIAQLEARGRHARRHELVVLDDSRDRRAQEDCQRLLRVASARYRVPIRYAGAPQRLGFAAALAGECRDVDPALIGFALADVHGIGWSGGANRNALLLDTAGDLVVSSDDDEICRVARLPTASPRLRFASTDPTEYWCFPSYADAIGALAFAGDDAFAAHESLLGRSLARCIAEAGGGRDVDYSGMDARTTAVLLAGGGAVRVTSLGTAGDVGARDASFALTRRGAGRDRLLASPASYRTACTSRQVIRCARQPTITGALGLRGMALGLDNRQLLPPFPPAGKNEDGVFGALVGRFAHLAALPWVVPHDPPDGRRFSSADLAPAPPRLCDVILAALATAPPATAPGPEAALAAAGRQLAALGALPPDELADRLAGLTRAIIGLRAGNLRRLLQLHGEQPAYWAADVRRYLAACARLLEAAHLPVPADAGPDPGLRLQRTGRYLRDYGLLLIAWPEIATAARRLRAAGRRLAGPV